jgi:hypothetical protein
MRSAVSHDGKSDKQLKQRLERDNKSVASGFYYLETAAVAIVRTIRHKKSDSRVRRWLGDNDSQRRLALRRAFEKPVGRIVCRDGAARDGKGVVAVLTKWQSKGKTSYPLLTAYVERWSMALHEDGMLWQLLKGYTNEDWDHHATHTLASPGECVPEGRERQGSPVPNG